ncbi:MAG: DUF423 domain-containing protein [Alphaproteobacteria bacterium]|nr:DUF423 domain-containing protein [Alphaproteobacteria bacterium]MBV9371564.1 DUF423 domain-containing protein [Alphaproteobacteria bacterium]MBV9902694.1 DUF423 domain-containing protein [Alphaproteobacteria bacterium]
MVQTRPFADRSPGRTRLAAGAALAGLAVAPGAFGAHALKARLGAEALGWWQTAVQYQMWHGLALLALSRIEGAGRPAALLAAGTVVFSGSLYAMALTGARWLGAVTPLGGLVLLAGWALLAARALRSGNSP